MFTHSFFKARTCETRVPDLDRVSETVLTADGNHGCFARESCWLASADASLVPRGSNAGNRCNPAAANERWLMLLGS